MRRINTNIIFFLEFWLFEIAYLTWVFNFAFMYKELGFLMGMSIPGVCLRASFFIFLLLLLKRYGIGLTRGEKALLGLFFMSVCVSLVGFWAIGDMNVAAYGESPIQPHMVFKGFAVFVVGLHLLQNRKYLKIHLWLFVVIAVAMALSVRLGLDDYLPAAHLFDASGDLLVFSNYVNYIEESFYNLNSNYYAYLLAMALLITTRLAFSSSLSQWKKLFLYFVNALLTANIILSGSRTAILAGGSGFAVIVIARYGKLRSKLLFSAIALFVLLSALFVAFPFMYELAIGRIFDAFGDLVSIPSHNLEYHLWARRDNTLLQRIGTGLEALKSNQYDFFLGTGGRNLVLSLNYYSGNHIDWIHWLTTYGIFALLFYTAITVYLGWSAFLKLRANRRESEDEAANASLAFGMIVNLFVFSLTSPMGIPTFFVWVMARSLINDPRFRAVARHEIPVSATPILGRRATT